MKWVQLAAYFFIVTGAITFLVTIIYWVYSRLQEKRARQWNESFERRAEGEKSAAIVAAPANHDSNSVKRNL